MKLNTTICSPHKHEHQLKHGCWYFHGSGLDITFGDDKDNIYGGILIRGIKCLTSRPDKPFIDGPIRCVQELSSNFGQVDDSMGISLHIKLTQPFHKDSNKEEVYSCRRVGINKAKDINQRKFYNEHYRFLIYPHKPHGEKFNIAEDLKSQKFTEKKINDLFGYKHFKI